MGLDTGQLKVAKLAQIQGVNFLSGGAGIEARIKRVRDARLTFWATIILGIWLPLFFIVVKSPAPPPLDVIVIVEGVLALMLLVEVLIGLEAAPFFAKDTFYANRIPGRALWDLSELGQFAVSDVTRVVVRSSNNVGIAWLDVRVYSRTGRKARFAGFTRAAMMAVADRRGALLPPKAKAELLAMGGGAEDVVELARSLNLPITMETDPTAGTPPPN